MNSLLPDQELTKDIKKRFFNAPTVVGEENPYYHKPYAPRTGIDDGAFEGMWANFGASFGTGTDADRVLWTPEISLWAKLAWREMQRLAPGVSWITGPAGTGKTTEAVRLVKKWTTSDETNQGRVWVVTTANVACEVLRRSLAAAGTCANVSTIHTRFDLAGRDGGFEGFPSWWPTPPNAGKKTVKGCLYIFDEVFFIDPRPLALALACIPTGSTVVFSGDPYQNRPISGVEFGYWLWKSMTHTVRVDDDSAAEAIWAHLGHGSPLDESISMKLRADLRDVPGNKCLALELTKLRRFDPSVSAIATAHEKIFNGEFPAEGPGLKITRCASVEKAVTHTVNLLNSNQPVGEKFTAIVGTNMQAVKVTAEYNRGGHIAITADMEEGLFFRKGQPCMVLVNDHSKGLHNGLVVRYVRWGRSRGKMDKRPFHEVEIPATPGKLVTRKVKIYYDAPKVWSIMRSPIHRLREEFSAEDLGMMLETSHAAECAGILCSPYVLTNHRAQGSTVGRAVVLIPGKWKGACAEWLYVALSRARHGVELVFADDPQQTAEENQIHHDVLKAMLLRKREHCPNPFDFYKPAVVDKAA